MSKRYSRIAVLLIAALFSAAILGACAKEDGKVPFTPESGTYTIYLEEGWEVLETNDPQQLFLSGPERLAFILTVNCFSKSDLKDPDADDFDSYIEAFNSSEVAMSIYEGNQVEPMVAFKEKSIEDGRRQKVLIRANEENGLSEDMISEVIHLETKDFYFILTYGNLSSRFEESQQIVSDAVKTLKINYAGK